MIDLSGMPPWFPIAVLIFVLAVWLLFRGRKGGSSKNNHFASEYFEGLNYLLNDEQGKALDILSNWSNPTGKWLIHTSPWEKYLEKMVR